ncbi:ABC transporter ATP-binding protein, partial [Phytoactinopolyspora endophytica]|uniref:ABC transporter ATP-binding protein n=1 Tax=Phytoactinopolyspora endophytica TaxID=1642495 RepID=UPI0013EA56AA
MAGLQVQGLTKRLGDHLAVDDVSFDARDGEFFVVLGSSGSGKTTTLRMICGLEEPDEGEIVIGGRAVTSLPPRERNLGMVFQEYGLYPSMDVFGNMAYGLQAQKELPKAEIESRVRHAAERLGLTDYLHRPITDLSGGEQQRVALGRAMVKDADAYLYDEPLSNLDPKLRHRIRRDIKALHEEKGKPSLYVTHDQAEALAMADVMAVMAHGRVQQVGPPTQLLDSPANVFVATFLGSPPMNLLTAVLKDSDGQWQAFTDRTALSLPPVWNGALSEYGKTHVTVGIPPSGLTLSPDDGS